MPLRKYLHQPDIPYPHMGKMLSNAMLEKQVHNARLADMLKIAPIGVTRYLKQPSLHGAILWKAGLGLKYNFFSKLSEQFPHKDANDSYETEMAAKDQRIRELEKELTIYKDIVEKLALR